MKKTMILVSMLMVSACSMKINLPEGSHSGVFSTGSRSVVFSEVSRFNAIPSNAVNSKVYIEPLKEQEGSVEFKAYAALFKSKLVDQGYQVVSLLADADYTVFLDYGVGVSQELTSDNTTYQKSTASSGDTTKRDSDTEYDRYLHFNMYEAERDPAGNPVQVYKGEVKSSGSSPTFARVSQCMINALFGNFTKTGVETVRANGKCLQ